MTVVFDGAALGDGPPTGVARAFLTGLAAYAAAGHRAVLLVPRGAEAPDLPGLEVVQAPRGALARQLVLPRLLRRLGARVLHSSVVAVPLHAPCPTLATAHDLPWLHPELGEPTRRWRRWATLAALQAAARVLAPSALTAADARSCLPPHARGKVVVVPHAVQRLSAPPDPNARTGPFLMLGDDRPRKNRAAVRAAHAQLRARWPAAPALQCVGPPDPFVTEAAKSTLLANCCAVVHCARFEGFGLPVLEALAHGAPLLCSDLPPHREIAADHALYVPADSIEAIAAGLLRVATDGELRAQLAAQGFARAAAFAPERLAARWRQLHDEVRR